MTEPARPAWLEGRTPALAGKQFDLGLGTTRIGRGSACPIVIVDPMISREHAEIRCEGGLYSITDLGSTHGTFVDGQQVQQAPLADGSIIRVGSSELAFRVSQDAVPTALIGPGGMAAAAHHPAVPRASAAPAPPQIPAAIPVVASRTPAAGLASAAKRPAGKRGWLIGCSIALVLALCGCALIIVLSMIGVLPFGLDALTGAGSPRYTAEDLTLALAAPAVDERPEILENFGRPDEFDLAIVQVEGGQVRRESWSYYGYGTRVDFVDGVIIWTIDLEPPTRDTIYPAWYDPTAFEAGMTVAEVTAVLISASPAGTAPEALDLSGSGEDLAGLELLAGDQITVGFENGVLVYVETLGMTAE